MQHVEEMRMAHMFLKIPKNSSLILRARFAEKSLIVGRLKEFAFHRRKYFSNVEKIIFVSFCYRKKSKSFLSGC